MGIVTTSKGTVSFQGKIVGESEVNGVKVYEIQGASSESVTVTPTNGSSLTMFDLDGQPVGTGAGTYPVNVQNDSLMEISFCADQCVSTLTIRPKSPKWQITESHNTGGTVSLSETEVSNGGEVTVTATPSGGYKISQITVNGQNVSFAPTGHTWAITNITQDINVVVSFVADTVYYVVRSGAINPSQSAGSISITDPVVASGGSSQVTCRAFSGYVIQSIQVNGISQTVTDPYVTIFTISSITEDKVVTMTLISGAPPATTYSVTTQIQAGLGTVSASPNSGIASGGSSNISVVPNSGYEIVDVYINNVPQTDVVNKLSYSKTITNITSNQTVRASFRLITPYALFSMISGGNNTGTTLQIVGYENNTNKTNLIASQVLTKNGSGASLPFTITYATDDAQIATNYSNGLQTLNRFYRYYNARIDTFSLSATNAQFRVLLQNYNGECWSGVCKTISFAMSAGSGAYKVVFSNTSGGTAENLAYCQIYIIKP